MDDYGYLYEKIFINIRAKVDNIKESLTKKEWSVSAKESRVLIGNGKYRYPDIIASKNNMTYYYQVGLSTMSGKSIARELRALRDLSASGKANKIFFVLYHR